MSGRTPEGRRSLLRPHGVELERCDHHLAPSEWASTVAATGGDRITQRV